MTTYRGQTGPHDEETVANLNVPQIEPTMPPSSPVNSGVGSIEKMSAIPEHEDEAFQQPKTVDDDQKRGNLVDVTLNDPSSSSSAAEGLNSQDPFITPQIYDNTRQRRYFDMSTGLLALKKQVVEPITFSGDGTATNATSRWSKVMRAYLHEAEENVGMKVFRVRRASIGSDEIGSKLGLAVSHMISESLRWSFRVSFWKVGIVSYLAFLVVILLFAVIIYIIGRVHPECLVVNGTNYTAAGTQFMDAFQLSWTTLSTVGYGVVSPGIPMAPGENRCIGINMFMAIESFVGVLFGAVVASIIIGKVARVQSIALVKFSDPIVIRYGSGLMTGREEKEDTETDHSEIPCPILEFRIINELNTSHGGAILDASVNVIGVTLEEIDETDRKYFQSMSHPTIKRGRGIIGKAANGTTFATKSFAKHTGAALLGAGQKASQATGSLIQRFNHAVATSGAEVDVPGSESSDVDPFKRNERQAAALGSATARQATRTSVTVDEGNSKLAPTRIYHKLEMETDSHPFFKRVWQLRHRLDAESPLLTPTARAMIQENGGYWPKVLNEHSQIRKHLHFKEIIGKSPRKMIVQMGIGPYIGSQVCRPVRVPLFGWFSQFYRNRQCEWQFRLCGARL